MNFMTIGIAGRVIGISARYSLVQRLCRDYLVDGKPDFSVACTEADLAYESALFESLYKHEPPSDVYLESTVLHRKVADGFVEYGVLLMHGTVVAIGDSAFLFTGPSGIGKTTHASRWLEANPEAYILNGDKPFLLLRGQGLPPLACGSPWNGKEELGVNAMVPLKAIIQLERSEKNSLEQVSFANAFPSMLQQVYRPQDEEKSRRVLKLLSMLASDMEFFRFECNNYRSDSYDNAYKALQRLI